MDQTLFNSTLTPYTGEIQNHLLVETLSVLKQLNLADLEVLIWDELQIAVPFSVPVDLPSRGTKDDIDIREVEPILFVFNLDGYPSVAPSVFTDRYDFPKNKLAHLYIAKNGRPPGFCYVTGDRNTWYANKRVGDLVKRIKNWFKDAATGSLAENGSQFDPIRLEGYSGSIVYDYDAFFKVVSERNGLKGMNFTQVIFDRVNDNEDFGFQSVRIVTMDTFVASVAFFNHEMKKGEDAKGKRRLTYGYLLWADNEKAYGEYEINFPRSWEQFKSFCQTYEIDIERFEGFITTLLNINVYVHFPVIVAIRRPATVIGFPGDIEFFNLVFRLDHPDVSEGKVITNIPGWFLAHNQPLTTTLAKKISGATSSNDEFSIAFGCGALGSKVILHFARSGRTKFVLVDTDTLSPHNLVRHALLPEHVGAGKAFALGQQIEQMYSHEKIKIITAKSFPADEFRKSSNFEDYKYLFDFTASESFFNQLVSAKSLDKLVIYSAHISDGGNLGILYKEGVGRNPRIDDIEAYLLGSYEDEKISKWLGREEEKKKSSDISVRVGMGCNSETTVLSDIKVSTHSSFFAGAINQLQTNDSEGIIYLNEIDDDGFYSVGTTRKAVPRFENFMAINASNWEIRFVEDVTREIRRQTVQADDVETGGVFLGIINWKTRVIHVLKNITAPPDSRANEICFYRGTQGLPGAIQNAIKKSGGQIGYIGEWHSHPNGPDCLSKIDENTVQRFNLELSELDNPLPAFLTIVTRTKILPHVF
jgi:hypothetical protein